MSPKPLNLDDVEERDEDDAKGRKRGPGRPPKTEALGDLRKAIADQLEELAAWIGRHDQELGETLREDVPRMAKVLSAWAGKHPPLAKVLRAGFAETGPLAALRAFGRTARTIGVRVSERRAERHDDEDDGGQPPAYGQPPVA